MCAAMILRVGHCEFYEIQIESLKDNIQAKKNRRLHGY